MWIATTLLLVALAPAQKNEAEELFKKMEDKVHKAKTIEFESDSTVEGPKKVNATVKATLTAANKGNFTMEFEDAGKKQSMKAISDGTKTRSGSGAQLDKSEDTPKHLSAGLATMITRMGILPMGGRGGSEDPLKADQFDKDKLASVSDFKLGTKEKIGDKETQAVEYQVSVDGKKKFAATVWIDTKTSLPVKRVISFTEGDQKTTLTETIKTFKLDEKVDDKLFELPKE